MSLRVDLSKENMDLVMHVVRAYDCKPTDAINLLLTKPQIILDARSKLYERNDRKENRF